MPEPPRHRSRWSPEDARHLTDLWLDHDPAEIGKRLRRTPESVKKKGQKMGLPSRHPESGANVMAALAEAKSLLSISRFSEKTRITESGCWHWLGATAGNGY